MLCTIYNTYEKKIDDNSLDLKCKEILDAHITELSNGIVLKKRKTPRILRHVNYNVKMHPEDHYRERMILFFHGVMKKKSA